VSAKNLQRSIRTRVIIGDYRIYVSADVVQCVSEDKCFVANAGDSDQKVPMAQEASIARNDLFPSRSCQLLVPEHDHHLAARKNWHR
jgi:hypothetical protein